MSERGAIVSEQGSEDDAVTLIPARSLDALTATVRNEHELVVSAGRRMLEHAVLCGNALREIKARVERGKWTEWADEHLPFAVSTAAVYVRLSLYADLLREEQIETVTAALQFLREHGLTDSPDVATDEQVARIAILRRRGLTPVQIAEAVGLPRDAVRDYLEDPERGSRRKRKAHRVEKTDRVHQAPRKRGRKRERIQITDDLIEGAALKIREIFGSGLPGPITDTDRDTAVEVLRAAFTYEGPIPTAERRLGEVDASEAEAIAQMWSEGLSIEDMSARMGCSPRALAGVMNRLRNQGYDLPRTANPHLLPKHPRKEHEAGSSASGPRGRTR